MVRSLRSLAPLVVPLLLAGCGGVLDPKGPVGEAQRLILFNSVAIMLCIVLPVIGCTLAFAWWYRASNTKARYLPDWAYSGRIELVVWAVPALVVLFLGGIAWIGSHDLDPARPLESEREPVEVQVVSLDWKWLFIYPAQQVASVNELVVPAGVPISFRLTSASVMNAFFVPQLGSMIYTMNGMETNLHLQADAPGQFEGMSSHYSGDGFSGMRFAVRSVPQAEFDGWVGTARGSGQPLDTDGYAKLAEQSQDVKPTTYRLVEPGLFDAIVRQTAPDAPGPDLGKPDVHVSPRSEG